MARSPEQLTWIHTRIFQAALVVLLVGWAVSLVASARSTDGVPLSAIYGVGLAMMFIGSVVDRHRITGRW